jgi:putative transposase
VKTRRQLAYKTRWNGGWLVAADRWFPLLQNVLDLPGSETHTAQSTRALHCEQLWPVIDCDRNAAFNLKHQVTRTPGHPEWLADDKRTWSRPEDQAQLGRRQWQAAVTSTPHPLTG